MNQCFIMTQDMALEKTMKINFKKSTDFIFSLNKIKQDEFILYHHLGLGDFIVCNGMVNYLSNKFKKIYIPVVSEPYFKMIQYLYSENENVNIFKIKNDNRDSQVIKFASTFELPILKVGFRKVRKQPFNEAFYNQLDLPYKLSFSHFNLPSSSKEKMLTKHLIDYYKVDKNCFNLVHSDSHDGSYDLKNLGDENIIFVNKDSDLFKNIFLYRDVIGRAQEIHCINSVFVHLVERLNSTTNLYFHNVRHSKMTLTKDWKIVPY